MTVVFQTEARIQFCDDNVCDVDAFCSAVSWDGLSADGAEVLCGSLCQVPEGCCTGLPEFPEACDVTTEFECIDAGGAYQGDGTSCNTLNQCLARPIPTMSEWGLICTAGILGLIAFLYIYRRRKQITS